MRMKIKMTIRVIMELNINIIFKYELENEYYKILSGPYQSFSFLLFDP